MVDTGYLTMFSLCFKACLPRAKLVKSPSHQGMTLTPYYINQYIFTHLTYPTVIERPTHAIEHLNF